MADRVAVMDDGRVQQVASPEELYPQPGQPVRRRVHRSEQRVRGCRGARWSRRVGDRVLPGTGRGATSWCGRRRSADRALPAVACSRDGAGDPVHRRHVDDRCVTPDGVATASGQPLLVTQPGVSTLERGAECRLTLGRGDRGARSDDAVALGPPRRRRTGLLLARPARAGAGDLRRCDRRHRRPTWRRGRCRLHGTVDRDHREAARPGPRRRPAGRRARRFRRDRPQRRVHLRLAHPRARARARPVAGPGRRPGRSWGGRT